MSGYEYSGGGGKGYGAIEQMDSSGPQRSAGSGKKGRKKLSGSGTPGPGEGGFLYEAGLGCDKDNWCRTTALLCCLVLLTVGVTAWMQTCVPFCGAKVRATGLWKKAWSNTTIPADMQSAMDTTVDPCQDFYQVLVLQGCGCRPAKARGLGAGRSPMHSVLAIRPLEWDAHDVQGALSNVHACCMPSKDLRMCAAVCLRRFHGEHRYQGGSGGVGHGVGRRREPHQVPHTSPRCLMLVEGGRDACA